MTMKNKLKIIISVILFSVIFSHSTNVYAENKTVNFSSGGSLVLEEWAEDAHTDNKASGGSLSNRLPQTDELQTRYLPILTGILLLLSIYIVSKKIYE